MPGEVTSLNGNGVPRLERPLSARSVPNRLDSENSAIRPLFGERADLCSQTPHERLCELTAILANGIHRLRAITPAPPECGQIPADSPPTCLDPGARSSPDGAVFTTRERGD